MNKKPGLLFSVYALAAVILASVFHFSLPGGKETATHNAKNIANYLFVCPMKSETWDSISDMLSIAENYIFYFVCFIVIVLLFSWGWALYQNLLKDKFKADVYKRPWEITKVVFWVVVVCVILVKTPNYYRAHVRINSTNWVLCENTSENARAVRVKNN